MLIGFEDNIRGNKEIILWLHTEIKNVSIKVFSLVYLVIIN